MTTPLVSIALVTRNGAETLPAVLAAIKGQHTSFPFETLAVDSGSTDGTVALLEDGVDRVVSISPATFDHGLTRNLAVEQARGPFVVLLVQDAVPIGRDWLTELTAPLRNDPTIAGTYARQEPRPEASRLTRSYLERAPVSSRSPRLAEPLTRSEWDRLSPMARLSRCAFDDVCSCLRRSVWQDLPFKATPFAEDLEWGKAVLFAGHRLAFVPGASVAHSHDRSISYEFRRTCVSHQRLFELFGLQTIPTIPLLLRAIAGSLADHIACEMSARSLGLAVAWPLGQYLGARRAIRNDGLRLGHAV